MLCSIVELIGTVALAASCRAPAPAVVVHEQAHTLTVYAEDGTASTHPVGLGMPGWETPLGTFRLRGAYAGPEDGSLGPVVLVTTARGRTDGGFSGTVAIHGTNRPELIPGNPSHGCIRLHNEDVPLIASLPAGTVLVVDR